MEYIILVNKSVDVAREVNGDWITKVDRRVRYITTSLMKCGCTLDDGFPAW